MQQKQAELVNKAKMAKLTLTEEPEASSAGVGAKEPRPGASSEDPESELPPGESDSENKRPHEGNGSSSDESDFDAEKTQTVLDDWMISLPALSRKMLSVLLVETFTSRLKMLKTAAALEATSITGFNNKKNSEKIQKKFYENKARYKEEIRGKYMRYCLLNDENLRLEAAMFVREHGY